LSNPAMGIQKDYPYIAEWIEGAGHVSFSPQYNGSHYVIANDEQNMVVCLASTILTDRHPNCRRTVVALSCQGLAVDEMFQKLNHCLKLYLEEDVTTDEINST